MMRESLRGSGTRRRQCKCPPPVDTAHIDSLDVGAERREEMRRGIDAALSCRCSVVPRKR